MTKALPVTDCCLKCCHSFQYRKENSSAPQTEVLSEFHEPEFWLTGFLFGTENWEGFSVYDYEVGKLATL